MKTTDYWKECISIAAEECELSLTEDQLIYMAESVESCHDNYGMAFYSPPDSDRISDIENDYKRKLKEKELELEKYKTGAESAIKSALKMRSDSIVSIKDDGSVFKYGGRIDQVL